MHIINLIRLKDWLKNILIFFPLIYSGLLFDQSYYTILILGFITFCIVASCVYMLNDILDVEKDKQHPTKKFTKPLAANKVSIKQSYLIFFSFIILLLFLLYFQPNLYFSILFYIIINLGYNLIFKNIPYLELILLSSGYVIRIDAGSKILSIDSSILMLTSTFFLALFFLILKRLCEINNFETLDNYPSRNVLKFYKKNYLTKLSIFSILFLVSTLLIYAFAKDISLIISIFLVLIFLLKYFICVRKNNSGENPISLILKNKILLFLSTLIMLSSLLIYI